VASSTLPLVFGSPRRTLTVKHAWRPWGSRRNEIEQLLARVVRVEPVHDVGTRRDRG
jgi:hypothetical protein